jgi:hypothetical protein
MKCPKWEKRTGGDKFLVCPYCRTRLARIYYTRFFREEKHVEIWSNCSHYEWVYLSKYINYKNKQEREIFKRSFGEQMMQIFDKIDKHACKQIVKGDKRYFLIETDKS